MKHWPISPFHLLSTPHLIPFLLSLISLSRFLQTSTNSLILPSTSSSIASSTLGPQNNQAQLPHNGLQMMKCSGSGFVVFPAGQNLDQVGFVLLAVESGRIGVKFTGAGNGLNHWISRILVQKVDDSPSDIAEGHKPVALAVKEDVNLNDQLEAIADMKFTYVATCQNYGNQKRQGNRHATDILNFMVKYPSLRVAYIDDVEVKEGENIQKVYYSVLIKAVENLDQEIYRIKLPGSAKIGEGKPENQNASGLVSHFLPTKA